MYEIRGRRSHPLKRKSTTPTQWSQQELPKLRLARGRALALPATYLAQAGCHPSLCVSLLLCLSVCVSIVLLYISLCLSRCVCLCVSLCCVCVSLCLSLWCVVVCLSVCVSLSVECVSLSVCLSGVCLSECVSLCGCMSLWRRPTTWPISWPMVTPSTRSCLNKERSHHWKNSKWSFSNHMRINHKDDRCPKINDDRYPIKAAGYTIDKLHLCKTCHDKASKANCGDHYSSDNRYKKIVILNMQILTNREKQTTHGWTGKKSHILAQVRDFRPLTPTSIWVHFFSQSHADCV